MKINNIKEIIITGATTILLSACGNGSSSDNILSSDRKMPPEVKLAIGAPVSEISQELANILSFMGNEERLAFDVYNKLYEEWGTKQFTNIATKSEYNHIKAVQGLIQKYKLGNTEGFTNIDMSPLEYMTTPIEEMQAGVYDISRIQNLYNDFIAQGMISEIDALRVGCMIEVIDIEDLDKDIALAQKENAIDIAEVFGFLREGSYSHYWAFDKGLKSKGIEDGCCSIGVIDGMDYCHPEYPKKDKKKGR